MSEQKARESLRKSVEDNAQQMAITQESRELLAAVLRDDMRIAVAEGISAAMTDANAQKFVRSMLREAQQMAAEKSVAVAGGALKALFMRALTFLFLGLIVYGLGGWSALMAFGKFLAAKD